MESIPDVSSHPLGVVRPVGVYGDKRPELLIGETPGGLDTMPLPLQVGQARGKGVQSTHNV